MDLSISGQLAVSNAHEVAPVFALGTMSGTSADGVDVALIRTDGVHLIEPVAAKTSAYDPDFRARLLQAAQTDLPLQEILELEHELTARHILACESLIDSIRPTDRSIEVIGLHGHTLRHIPAKQLTWQIGNAAMVAQALGCAVVSDFRKEDMAAGGQGAPLAPMFHAALFRNQPKPTLVINIGGVANITWIGAKGELIAGDTGPGCALLDHWAQHHFDQGFDQDGELAKSGKIHEAVVSKVLEKPYFQQPLPKAADRFDFDFSEVSQLPPRDCLATLAAITVGAITQTLSRLDLAPQTTVVAGGGSRHSLIMQLLENALADEVRNVVTAEETGWNADSLEAECFAWLAVRRLRNLPTSLPTTTGCQRPVCGGVITPSPNSHPKERR